MPVWWHVIKISASGNKKFFSPLASTVLIGL